jgi:hypothetical protein
MELRLIFQFLILMNIQYYTAAQIVPYTMSVNLAF